MATIHYTENNNFMMMSIVRAAHVSLLVNFSYKEWFSNYSILRH